MIGQLVKLKEPMFGNQTGDIGVCFNDYTLDGRTGSQFIFPNGYYDGFSEEEQDRFLEKGQVFDKYKEYRFISVICTSNDYNFGFFKQAFVTEFNQEESTC